MTRLLTGLLSTVILAAAVLGTGCSISDSTGSSSARSSAATSTPAGQTQAITAAPTEAPTDKPTDTPTEAPTATSSNSAIAVAGAQAEFAHVRVYLNAIQDPASSKYPQFVQPAAGNRFVAFDVTIEFFNDSGTHSANMFNFSLSDAQSFAYDLRLMAPIRS
jgi:hypothetical protein